ncbi:MAG TPA: preprotein translocase subunit SecA, partial [Candidatus Polarisedimenticolia bacterium]|nr:preprotein translocase subunit SecA [Candidatus Polarisedimenticolia bacterium]
MLVDAVLRLVIGSKNDRELRKLAPRVAAITALGPAIQALTDEQLRDKTREFRLRLDQGASLEDLLHEAFAVVREAGRRVLNMRHFDVQLIGGMVLHQGKIAEMKTGEGKTLVATLPVYLNSLAGRGVHVVTVNDYLARRDADWMGRLYRFLDRSVGVIQHDQVDPERQNAYGADVTYGTNNEFGFDYLRDNMKYSLESFVQRGHVFGIVDEVDSILIDEARTPLIISGPSDESVDRYYEVDRIIPRLKLEGDYQVDEKARTVNLTEEGVEKVEKLLGVENLYDPEAMEVNHCVQQALKAHVLFKQDVDYMVKDGQVVIVDEFTGRLMPGRRWSDGLHQAVEAKEKVKIEKENQTLATITFQNYFRMYEKLAGMTGTADTEAVEFDKIYNLEVLAAPTNRPLIRHEFPDVVYRTEDEKFRAVVGEIGELHEKGQPVLVGTVSIEKSERLSSQLKKRGVPHVVLNAKYHEREAEIVAQAGRHGAVTIATNMAGRGTDILLGGNPEYLARKSVAGQSFETPAAAEESVAKAMEEARIRCAEEHEKVVALGGLHILGTERHEARRIDNQLRGRAGRQGDPGSSRFYLSLEDDLLRIFGSDRLKGVMQKLGMEEDVPIVHGMVTRSIERAQKQVEARNFDIRKHLLEYDDVMNKQRVEIYRLRRELLEGKGQKEYILQKMEEILDWIVDTYASQELDPSDWSIGELAGQMTRLFGIDPVKAGVDFSKLSREEVRESLGTAVQTRYAQKETALGPEIMRHHERLVMLNVIDTQWKDHLLAMDHLKEGIGLRGYGQRDPLTEYKRESFEMFAAMKERIEDDIVRFLFLVDPLVQKEEEMMRRRQERDLVLSAPAKEAAEPARRSAGKVGRNDPCPCGSG